MKATISIVCHLALAQAKSCIASVLNGGGDFDLILTANGNLDAFKYFGELGSSREGIKVIMHDHNRGFIEPNKLALQATDSPIFVMLNDDAIVPKGWLGKIVEQFEKHPTASVVGPIGRRLRDNFVGGLPCSDKEPPEYIEGCCFAIRTDLAKLYGLFDPNLHFAYGEESDCCLRMRQLGYTIHVAPFQIIHNAGTTTRHVPEAKLHFDMNHAYLRNKWSEYLKTHKFPHE
jgi:GT2 family glycosyltransferase